MLCEPGQQVVDRVKAYIRTIAERQVLRPSIHRCHQLSLYLWQPMGGNPARAALSVTGRAGKTSVGSTRIDAAA